MMAGVELVIVVFGAASGADLFLENMRKLESGGDLFLLDAVLVSKDVQGDIEVTETQEVEGERGALLGAASGALIGLLAGPVGGLVGMAVGAVTGGVASEAIDTGIADEMIDDFEERLPTRSSAFLALAESEWVARIEAAAESMKTLSEVTFRHWPMSADAAEKVKNKAKKKK